MVDPLQLIADLNQIAVRELDPTARRQAILQSLKAKLSCDACSLWQRYEHRLVELHSEKRIDLAPTCIEEIQQRAAACGHSSSAPLVTNSNNTLLLVTLEGKEREGNEDLLLSLAFDRTLTSVQVVSLLRALRIVLTWMANKSECAADAPPWLPLFQNGSYQEAVTTIVNLALRFTQADRVTLLRFDGKRFHTEAISGQSVFDRRANTIRSQEAWVRNCLTTSGSWVFPSEQVYAPEAEEILEAYLAHSPVQSAVIIPLREIPLSRQSSEETAHHQPPIAALLVESFRHQDSRLLLQRAESFGNIASVAYQQSLIHKQAWFLPGSKTLPLARSSLLKKAFAFTLMSLFCFALLTIQLPLRIEAQGSAQPVERCRVFARTDGIVRQVYIEEGQSVEKGDLLLELENPELEHRRIELRGELQAVEQRMIDLKNLRLKQVNPRAEALSQDFQFASELQQLEVQRASLKSRLDTLDKERQQLEIRAPLDGIVLNWEPKQALQGRPVTLGQELIEITNPKGPWRAELHVVDRQAGPVISRWQREPKGALVADYYFANAPERRCRGAVNWVSKTAQVQEGRNGLLLYVDLESNPKDPYIVGTRVSGRIVCDRCSLAWIAFRDIAALFDREIAFRFFPAVR